MGYSDWGWLAVAATVAVIEYKAPRGQLLSHGAARYKRNHPVATAVVVWGLAAHLYGVLPKRIDPLHQFARACGR